jgi:hypothetical protein
MLLHVVIALFATLPLFVESSLFVHLLQVALTIPFPAVDEMAFTLQ